MFLFDRSQYEDDAGADDACEDLIVMLIVILIMLMMMLVMLQLISLFGRPLTLCPQANWWKSDKSGQFIIC